MVVCGGGLGLRPGLASNPINGTYPSAYSIVVNDQDQDMAINVNLVVARVSVPVSDTGTDTAS